MICFKNLIVVALIASIGLNLYLIHHSPSPNTPSNQSPTTSVENKFQFLSKRIFVDDPNDTIINFVPLRATLTEYINKTLTTNPKGKLGLYFEYLPTGNSIGINEKDQFIEASLIKLPTVMAILKLIELDTFNHQTQLEIQQDDLDFQSGDAYKLGAGAKMKLDDAINLSLTQSDNTAFKVLRRNIPAGFLENVYDYLDIPITNDTDQDPIISPKNYSSILRSLYLSSYNNREHSNEILQILTHDKNRNWLGLLLPEELKVARKDGTFIKADKTPTYSDCGIIYAPKRPFALCIMANGFSEDQAKQHISTLALKTFHYVSTVNLAK